MWGRLIGGCLADLKQKPGPGVSWVFDCRAASKPATIVKDGDPEFYPEVAANQRSYAGLTLNFTSCDLIMVGIHGRARQRPKMSPLGLESSIT